MASDSLFVYFDAPPGHGGQRKVALPGDPRLADEIAPSACIVRDELQDKKVGGSRSEVNVHCCGHRAHGVMGSHGNIVGFGHGGDLTHLQKATTDADVGLDNIRRLGL
jgi:hypothetical protein